MVGKKCLIRATGAGVHFGEVVKIKKDRVTLKDARRIWRWRGANTLNELANGGASLTEFTRIADPVAEMIVIGAHEIIPVTKAAAKNLEVSRWLD